MHLNRAGGVDDDGNLVDGGWQLYISTEMKRLLQANMDSDVLAMVDEIVEVWERIDSGMETDEDGVLDLEIDNDGVADDTIGNIATGTEEISSEEAKI